MQRITAAALVPLGVWFAWSVRGVVGSRHAEFVAWVAHPMNSVLLFLLVMAGFYHGWLGYRVVIEDYVQGGGARTVGLALGAGVVWLAAAVAGFAILRAALGGA